MSDKTMRAIERVAQVVEEELGYLNKSDYREVVRQVYAYVGLKPDEIVDEEAREEA